MPATLAVREGPSLKPFWLTVIGTLIALAIAGLILAQRHGFPAVIAVPVVAAFGFQATVYLAAVFPQARAAITRSLSRPALAAALIAASLAPYLIYAIPSGVFEGLSFSKLAALCVIAAGLYVVAPALGPRLHWQDVAVACLLAYPMISGLSPMFKEIYVGFDPPANRLDSLGKLMLIPLGIFVFLALRDVKGIGLRLWPTRQDWRYGIENFLFGLPILAVVAVFSGFASWQPPADIGRALLEAAGKLVGIYLTVALAEEFLLRGVIQNLLSGSLGSPKTAQLISAILFGATHLGRGGFPNWPYFATATVLGWFCGRAFSQSGSLAPAMITHTLVVVAQTLFFQ